MSATLQTSAHGKPVYVDHPGPSVVLVALYAGILALVAWTFASTLSAGHSSDAVLANRILASVVALILGFHLWQIYGTYYTLSGAGIEVRYGPWSRLYPWTDFVRASAKRGLFATRIGWPSVTPCVRMWNGVVLKRRRGFFGLYLTPGDPREFLRKLGEFAPELTGIAHPGGAASSSRTGATAAAAPGSLATPHPGPIEAESSSWASRIGFSAAAILMSFFAIIAITDALRGRLDPIGAAFAIGTTAVAVLCWRATLRAHLAEERRRMRIAAMGGLGLGAIGFAAGFFGPIALAPEANQGPLLGIFITGPLGFLLGAVLGYGYAALRERPERVG